MAAQINKQVAKDSVKSAQKIAHEEKERKARIQIERMHYDGGRRSPSPERYRSVLSFAPGLEIITKVGAMIPLKSSGSLTCLPTNCISYVVTLLSSDL